MRFVLCTFLISIFLTVNATAKPGDVYSPDHEFPKPNRMVATSPGTGKLQTLPGCTLTLLERNLHQSSAIASHGNDLYLLESEGGILTKVRDRDGDGRFETSAPYLIGFDHPVDLAVTEKYIFVTDRKGLWRVDIEPGLSATKSPTLYMSIEGPLTEKTMRYLAYHSKTHTLYFSNKTGMDSTDIYEINIESEEKISKTTYPFRVSNLAVTPANNLYAIRHIWFQSDIVALRGIETEKPQSEDTVLPGRFFRSDMVIFPMDVKDSDYPDDWNGTLIVTLQNGFPMVASVPFEYGAVSKSMTSIVEGFAERSARVGSVNVRSTPTAITVMNNGRIVFADNKGNLWAIDKTKPDKPRSVITKPEPKTPMVKPDPYRSFKDSVFSGDNKVQNKKSPPEEPDGDTDQNLKPD